VKISCKYMKNTGSNGKENAGGKYSSDKSGTLWHILLSFLPPALTDARRGRMGELKD
jgi:hypothetical protein